VYKEKVMKHSIEIEKIESVSKIGFLGMTKSIYKAQAINRVQRRESTEQCWEWKRKHSVSSAGIKDHATKSPCQSEMNKFPEK
jgi:hypothetical protein